jgi:hypothetical protein
MIQLTWPVQEQFGQLIKKMMKLRNKNKNKNKNEEEKKAHHNEAM